jgi:hypothetical protein
MENDPELSGRYLGTITKDFVRVADTIKEAAYQIKVRGISDYPIFVICKEEQAIGMLLLGAGELGLEWNYYASFLGEFIDRQIVEEEAVSLFQQAYKDPDEFACIFVVDMDFTSFVFIPYPED